VEHGGAARSVICLAGDTQKLPQIAGMKCQPDIAVAPAVKSGRRAQSQKRILWMRRRASTADLIFMLTFCSNTLYYKSLRKSINIHCLINILCHIK
jgi:hypothetical protein